MSLQGTTITERVVDAIRQAGVTNKSELARQIGCSYRLLHAWMTGEKRPGRKHLPALADALGVTIEELLGVADGQDPPFSAWTAFESTAEGQGMSDGERRALQSLAWPPGRAPTVASYQIALAALRSTVPRT